MYGMTDEELELEQYNEQMFERRANGLEAVPFEEWKERRERIRQLFFNEKEGESK